MTDLSKLITDNDCEQLTYKFLSCTDHKTLNVKDPNFPMFCCRRNIQLTAISLLFTDLNLYRKIASKPWYNPIYDIDIVLPSLIEANKIESIKYLYEEGVFDKSFDNYSNRIQYSKLKDKAEHDLRDQACRANDQHALVYVPQYYSDMFDNHQYKSCEERFETAVVCAVGIGSLEIIKFLFSIGKDIEVDELIGLAIGEQDIDVVKFLCSSDDVESFIKHAVLTAAYLGDIEVIKYLYTLDCVDNSFNDEALREACENQHLEVIRYLCSLERD